jgi:3-oxoacid CoA-transferase subunit A
MRKKVYDTAAAADPDCIHTPGIFVNRILQGPDEKRIEQRTVRAA